MEVRPLGKPCRDIIQNTEIPARVSAGVLSEFDRINYARYEATVVQAEARIAELEQERDQAIDRLKHLACTAHMTKGDLGNDCVLCAHAKLCARFAVRTAELEQCLADERSVHRLTQLARDRVAEEKDGLRDAAEAAVEYLETFGHEATDSGVMYGLRVALGMDGETGGGGS